MFLDTLSELWIWQLLGRMHPLIVHFPIGVLIVAFLLELLTFKGKRHELQPVDKMCIQLSLESEYGKKYKDTMYLTIHKVPGKQVSQN